MFTHHFISYARGDGEQFAVRLRDDLEKRGFNTWFDRKNIPPGADFDAAIDEGLANARAILVVMTPGAVASHQVKSEWYDGINRYLPVIPLLVKATVVPRVLRVFNYMDFIEGYEQGLRQLIDTLEHLGTNHLQYIKQALRAFEVAQQESPDPRRFKTKILDLRNLIENWERRGELQVERISSGLEETRQSLSEVLQASSARHTLRIVGQRPLEVTEFFRDRMRERAAIHDLLSNPRTRLISIIGRGGMGKTALACKVIGEIEQENWSRADGHLHLNGIVYLGMKTAGISFERIFHDCSRLLDADEEAAMVRVWGNVGLSSSEKINTLLNALKHGEYLVVLDNIEDLLDDNGVITDEDVRTFVDTTLSTTSTLRLIVTSRIPIVLRRELIPFDKQVHLTDGLPLADAVQLLRDLDPNGNYGLLDALDEKLHALATMTRGVPRALEVVVGLLANDPFTSIDDILTEFFQNEDVVNELVEENYKRLDRGSRRVLEVLAVFGCPVSPVAIDFALAPFEHGLDVPAVLRRLVNTHVVNVDRETKTVSLHPIDQDYAYSQIPDGPRQEHLYTRKSLNSRIADYYKQIKIDNPDWTSIHEIEPQVLEIEHRLRAEEYDRAAIALGAIDERMATRGIAKKAKALRDLLVGRIGDPHLQLAHETKYSFICRMLGLLEQGAAANRNAIELARQLDDKPSQLRALVELSEDMRFLGYLEEATGYVEEAKRIGSSVSDPRLQARLYWSLSIVSTYNQDYWTAVDYNYEMLKYTMEMNDTEQIAFSHNALGINYIALRDYEKAREHVDEALRLYTAVNNRDSSIYIINMSGLIHLGQGKLEQAIIDFVQALEIAREDNNTRPEALCLYNLARAYRTKGELPKALEHASASAEVLERIGANYTGAAQTLVQAIRASLARDSYSEAQALVHCARETSVNPDFYDPLELADAALQIATAKGYTAIAQDASDFIEAVRARIRK